MTPEARQLLDDLALAAGHLVVHPQQVAVRRSVRELLRRYRAMVSREALQAAAAEGDRDATHSPRFRADLEG